MNLSLREKEILLTLKIFDFFERPATSFEIWKNLFKLKNLKKPTLFEIVFLLENSKNLKKLVEKKYGFYFLKGKDFLAEKRIFQDILFDKKFEKLKKLTRFLKYLPFLEGGFVCGSMAIGNVKKESDFDLILIAKNGRIWTLRFFALLLYEILFARRKGLFHSKKTSENKICLSCFLSLDSMVFLKNYFRALEFLNLIFVYGKKEIFLKFFEKNNWQKDYTYFSQIDFEKEKSFEFQNSFLKKILEKILKGKFGDVVEKFLKFIQIKRINSFLRSYQIKTPQRIEISDKRIEIHLDISKEIKLEKEIHKFLSALLTCFKAGKQNNK